MNMKTFGLHFRYRDEKNELFDVGLTVLASSQKQARATAKAMERPESKIWFLRFISVQQALATGGSLP